ncbi:MAG: hypothetical protein ACTSRU_21050 [Candidatus Hodarchaeales archaeon]
MPTETPIKETLDFSQIEEAAAKFLADETKLLGKLSDEDFDHLSNSELLDKLRDLLIKMVDNRCIILMQLSRVVESVDLYRIFLLIAEVFEILADDGRLYHDD